MILYVIIVVIEIPIVFDDSSFSSSFLFFQHRYSTICFLFFRYIVFFFQMSKHFFQAVHPIWYPLCDGGLLQLGILTFCPKIMPYESLGFYGIFTRYLAENYHTLLLIVFWISMFLHVFEAWIARGICRRLKMDAQTSQKWIVQTLLVGYVSLGTLRQHAASKSRQS